MDSDVKHACHVCGHTTSLICSRCKTARYCSVTCQRTDWNMHKLTCTDCKNSNQKKIVVLDDLGDTSSHKPDTAKQLQQLSNVRHSQINLRPPVWQHPRCVCSATIYSQKDLASHAAACEKLNALPPADRAAVLVSMCNFSKLDKYRRTTTTGSLLAGINGFSSGNLL